MQSGISLVWLLMVGLTGVAWLGSQIALVREGKLQNRRQMTGCELARQFLDSRQLNQVPIHPLVFRKGVSERGSLSSLVLAEKIYAGTRLQDLTWALHKAVHFWKRNRALLPDFLVGSWKGVLPLGIAASWVLLLGGFFIPAFRGMVFWGQAIFIAFFLRASALFAQEWETAEEALAYLNRMEGWMPEERFRMKRLAKATRWNRFAELFDAPFTFFPQRTRCPIAT